MILIGINVNANFKTAGRHEILYVIIDGKKCAKSRGTSSETMRYRRLFMITKRKFEETLSANSVPRDASWRNIRSVDSSIVHARISFPVQHFLDPAARF